MAGTSTLFRGPGFEARPLAAAQVPLLQALFDANPGDFVAINGRPAGPDAAQAEFDELPPPHLPFRQRWVAGVFGPAQQLLGVVVGNQRAQRFWQRQGFAEARQRHAVDTGGRLNSLQVLVKPLAGGTLADYRHLVPRNCPESPLP